MPIRLRRTRLVPWMVAALMAAPAPAWGQTATAAPVVVDQAPSTVRFRGSATITGHLEDGAAGDLVSLERRPPGGGWTVLQTVAADDSLRVRFELDGLKRTAYYRLTRPVDASIQSASGEVAIRVRPRLTLRVKPRDVLVGRAVSLGGRLYPVVDGRTVVLQHRVKGTWRVIARVAVRDGAFSAFFEPSRVGRRRVRVRFKGDELNTAARRTKRLRVYRRALATWYGPGFYGRRTACGKRLQTWTLGVAHRWLPCGTLVRLLHRRRTITVPVIDRGPYTDADWDLTAATAQHLRFSGERVIGVLVSR